MAKLDRPKLIFAGAAALFLTAASHSVAQQPSNPAAAAPAWHGTDLKVLPATITRPELVATMKGFAQALGVRCTFCHVGTEGQPATFDFASDAKPNKDIARAMLRMVIRLDSADLPAIPGLKDPKVTCYTCHRGAEKPLTAAPEPSPAPPPAAS